MDRKAKIRSILEAIKFEVEDVDKFEHELDAILDMFNELKDVDVQDISATLNRKKITLSDLREDISKDWEFRKDIRGSYFKVPNVSKK